MGTSKAGMGIKILHIKPLWHVKHHLKYQIKPWLLSFQIKASLFTICLLGSSGE